jgi:hypothetical protein
MDKYITNNQTTPEDYKKQVKTLLKEMESAFNEYSNKMGSIWVKITENLKNI